MIRWLKYFFIVIIGVLGLIQNVYGQNSYGWERIFNSVYGINGFYSHRNADGSKLWMVRSVGDLFGTGNYEFIKYNPLTNSWFVASHSIFKGIYYSYYVGGGHSITGWALPNSFAISNTDSNFIIINSVEPQTGSPPYDIRLFISDDNGQTKIDVPYFQYKPIYGIAINPNNDSISYCSALDSIFASTTRGASWTFKSKIPYFSGNLILNPFDENIIYALDDSSFYRSEDGGVLFSNVLNKKISRIKFNYQDSSLLTFNDSTLYKSTNFGVSMNNIYTFQSSINDIEFDPQDESIIYAGTNAGLFKSTNSGMNFYMFNNSFSPTRRVNGLCKVPNTNFIYVATEEAVYKCWYSYVIGLENNEKFVPEQYILFQNYPNPFNPRTIIRYHLPSRGHVSIRVFSILGNEIMTLVNEEQNQGSHVVEFEAKNYSSGIYYYKMEADGKTIDVKRMVYLK